MLIVDFLATKSENFGSKTPKMYPDFDKFFNKMDQTKIISIATEDSLIDSHCFWLTAHFVEKLLANPNNKILLKSYRFKTFQITAMLTKAGMNRISSFVQNGQLTILDVSSEVILPDISSESCSQNVLILDGFTSILEQNSANFPTLLSFFYQAEAKFTKIIYKTEYSPEIAQENQIVGFLRKRSDIFIQTEPTSFVSTSVHGRVIVEDQIEEVTYKRHYFVKDRILKLMPIGSS